MSWCRRLAFPVRRVWLTLATRVRPRKTGGGILKLRNDVQTCGYQDVQVMWEILRRSEMEIPKENKRSFWRIPMWSNKTSSCVSDKDHQHHQQQKQKQQQKHHSSF
ncbi:hypothetical protein IHE45_09G006400 [Dioscorea alata]|uniref:Uncharacterized protein n=1 Tax=Dioscorea alata TaxID=55571 RepID=A0ACB7VDF9_DIOAL|nr:hypothetical protein IHE45_09G006400 [Dioscorea alata]